MRLAAPETGDFPIEHFQGEPLGAIAKDANQANPALGEVRKKQLQREGRLDDALRCLGGRLWRGGGREALGPRRRGKHPKQDAHPDQNGETVTSKWKLGKRHSGESSSVTVPFPAPSRTALILVP